jgi:hypothetical protein
LDSVSGDQQNVSTGIEIAREAVTDTETVEIAMLNGIVESAADHTIEIVTGEGLVARSANIVTMMTGLGILGANPFS